MDKKKRIEVNSSSLVGLKAELIRKQEEFKREKLDKSSKGSRERPVPKKTSIWNKKNAGINSRNQKDAEELEKERNEIEKSRSMLEAKAKLYEQMTAGSSIPDEQTNSLFLVDFEKKQLDKLRESKKDAGGRKPAGQAGNSDEEEDVLAPDSEIAPPSNPEEEWVDYTDTLGRSRRCMKKDLPDLMKMDKNLHPEKFREESLKTDEDGTTPELMSSDMQRERMRKKWEQEEQELLERGQTSIHYQNVRFDEVRTHGVGYFDFAKDQETRDQQMNTLKFLRDETIDKRAKREELKAKRKAAMEARLEKVRQRKKMKAGLVEEPGLKEDGSSEKEMGEAEKMKNIEEEKPKVEEAVDPNWQRTLRLIEAAKKESQKATREWDVGKEPKAWADQRAKMRDERPAEFAPPTDYTPNSARKRGKIFNQSQKLSEGDSVPGKSENHPSWRHSNTREQLHGSKWEEPNFNNQRNYELGHDMATERFLSRQERSEDGRERDCSEQDVKTNSWSGESVKLDQHSLDVKDKELNRPLLQSSNSNVEDNSLGNGVGTSKLKEVSESVTDRGQSLPGGHEAQSSNQLTVDAETKEAVSGHRPAPLIRTENSKPIKFSIGIGNKRNDKVLPSSSNALETDEAEEIKRTLSFFRNQAS
ncbi:hypothetical protein HOLleu_02908 [Holothuria leucospilota]|uniref:CCDC174 alpha/beta GRSR domain-containing protein n=1 Tax=Holothuria leucospilota TaxID=206669 RepID=A0A9Q1CT16_HOLLE|nr:hypothetical protein HOLleu_02908 [Holothuria leucospilota]